MSVVLMHLMMREFSDVKYYLVAILFILFDLETAFMRSLGSCLPWRYWATWYNEYGLFLGGINLGFCI